MGFFNKFKEVIGLEEYDYEDEGEITEEEIAAASATLDRKTVEPRAYTSPLKDGKERSNPLDTRNMKDSGESKVTSMSSRLTAAATTALKLVVTEPSSFDECPKLVDNLKARKPVIINLVNLDPGIARKIFDFLSGATYALNGNVQKIADYIFVFAPENVDIAASMEQKGVDLTGGNKNSFWR